MKKICTVLGVMGLVVSLTTSYAADKASKPVRADKSKTAFVKYDTDKDGKVSLDEWKAKNKKKNAEAAFKVKDKDGDGFLTAEEFSAKTASVKKVK